jgi:hypothetical protein
MNEIGVRSDGLVIPVVRSGATGDCANSIPQRAGKRMNAIRSRGTEAGRPVAVKQREVCVQIVDFEAAGERRVPPREIS